MSKKILTKFQRNKLLNAQKRKRDKRCADRIKTILLLDDGLSFSFISKVLFINGKAARSYKKSYDESGLDHLITDS